MTIANLLSRLARQEQRVDNFHLPVLLHMLLKELPTSIRKAKNIRVNAERDTPVVTRMVQRWREPTNPISNTIGQTSHQSSRAHKKKCSFRRVDTFTVIK
jgi:hypothetical protein